MITNEKDIEKLEEYNKIYIPEELLNNNYRYILDNDNIQIITNENCYTQYTTTYCDCITYNTEKNIKTKKYQCNTNTSTREIEINQITSDVNYSKIMRDIFYSKNGIAILTILVGLTLFSILSRERKSL